jgi:uncharacterized OsmC-like protein
VDTIRRAIEETERHLAEDPDAGREPDAPATAVLAGGLSFRVSGPSGQVATDMGPAVGGDASAPTPGWLLRAALASCDATVIAIEAARAGIELTRLEVAVESVSDARGTLGVGDPVPPGPLGVRVRVAVAATDASDDELRALVELAESRSPVGDALARAVPVTTEVVTGFASR